VRSEFQKTGSSQGSFNAVFLSPFGLTASSKPTIHNQNEVQILDKLDGRGSILAKGNTFYLLHSLQIGSGFRSAFYLTGTGTFPLRVKRPDRETDHLPPSRAEVKKGGAITPLPYKLSRSVA
jgi:hypothetical protein